MPKSSRGVACRYVKAPQLGNDAAFDNYHALADIASALSPQLLVPGATSAAFSIELAHTFTTTANAALQSATPWAVESVLPPPATPGPKAKVVEAAMKPGDDGIERCGWKGTCLQLEISLSNPVVAAWKPPPKPSKPLREIVTLRPPEPPAPNPTAREAFRATVAGVHRCLVMSHDGCWCASMNCCPLKLPPLE
jgi:hypothetical protein